MKPTLHISTRLIFLSFLSLIVLLTIPGCDTSTTGNSKAKDEAVTAQRDFYAKDLQTWLNDNDNSGQVKIVIGLTDNTTDLDFDEPSTFEKIEVVNGEVKEYNSKGQLLTETQIAARNTKAIQSMKEKAGIISAIRQEKANELLTRITEPDSSAISIKGKDDISDLTVNAIATAITCTMSRKQVLELEQHKDLIAGVELYAEQQATLANALEATKVSTVAHPRGWDGSNIGIYIKEASGEMSPDKDATDFNKDKYERLNSKPYPMPTQKDIDHATQMIITMQKFAPDAMIYGGKLNFLDDPGGENPPAYIYNYSWNKAGGNDNSYTIETRDLDNHIYLKKITSFCSSGNEGDNVTSPGAAFNTITVGGYSTWDNTVPDAVNNYIDPETGCEKPELVAPGYFVRIGDYGYQVGSSIATALTSGFTACLMEKYSFFRNRPYLVKAILMAGADSSINPGNNTIDEKSGAGAVDFYGSYYNWNGWKWDGANNEFFDENNYVTVKHNLTKGKRYRIALAWLSNGSYVYQNKKINMDLDLRVRYDGQYNGKEIITSRSANNSFEIVDFVAEFTGEHKIIIERYKNRDTTSRVIMGLIVRRL